MENKAQVREAVPGGYKKTDIGVIPIDWSVKQLRNVCEMKSGFTITSKNIADSGLYKCYGGNGVRGFTNTKTHSGEYVLIGRQGALCGNIQYVQGDFFASEHAVVVSALPYISVKWLSYYLKKMNLNQYSESTAQPGVSVKKILILPISVPSSYKEQRAIATALGEMDALIETQAALIAKKRLLKAGVMRELLTPKAGWVEKTLGEVTQLHRNGINPARYPAEQFCHFSLPAFDANRQPVIELGAEILSMKFRVPDNAVLLSKLNPRIPRNWIAKNNTNYEPICSTEFLVLTPTSLIRKKFLYYSLSSEHFVKPMEMAATGTTSSHQRIGPSQVLKITIQMPSSLQEQTTIAETLSTLDAELDALTAQLDKYRQLKQGMMQELLTGKTRLV